MLNTGKRALVISGGGSKGSFAGGFAEYLIDDLKINYDIFLGTSTGSLLIPHLSIGKIDKIKDIYCSVTQKDIYNINPFRVIEKADGTIKTSINHINTMKMFFKRKKTLGEHTKLKTVIKKILSEEDFNEVKRSGKTVVVTVANLTNGTTEYKHIADNSYDQFIDWMWASTSFVPFMSLYEKDGYEYADGGFGNYLPIEEAVNLGAKVVDAIVLVPRMRKTKKQQSKNAFELFLTSMDFMMQQLAKQDMMIGYLESIYNKDVKVNFYFTPRLLTKHSFYFKPAQMKKWWKEGYEFSKQEFKT